MTNDDKGLVAIMFLVYFFELNENKETKESKLVKTLKAMYL